MRQTGSKPAHYLQSWARRQRTKLSKGKEKGHKSLLGGRIKWVQKAQENSTVWWMTGQGGFYMFILFITIVVYIEMCQIRIMEKKHYHERRLKCLSMSTTIVYL